MSDSDDCSFLADLIGGALYEVDGPRDVAAAILAVGFRRDQAEAIGRLEKERDASMEMGCKWHDTVVGLKQMAHEALDRAEKAEQALEAYGYERCDDPLAWKPKANTTAARIIQRLISELKEVKAENARMRMALCDISAERQNLQDRADDSQVAHRMCDTADQALTSTGASQPDLAVHLGIPDAELQEMTERAKRKHRGLFQALASLCDQRPDDAADELKNEGEK